MRVAINARRSGFRGGKQIIPHVFIAIPGDKLIQPDENDCKGNHKQNARAAINLVRRLTNLTLFSLSAGTGWEIALMHHSPSRYERE